MLNGLAAVFASIDDGAVALGQSFLAGDLGDYPEQMSEQRSVLDRCFGERADVLARDNQHMHGGVGMNVGEGDTLLVLEDADGGDASVDDFAEQAGHIETSVSPAEAKMDA